MSISILGLGTAVPPHTMSQTEALQLAQDICDFDPRKHRMLDVLFRKSGVLNRHTCLPHRAALRWLEPAGPYASVALAEAGDGPKLGPSTQERMQLYEQHAFALAREATDRALDAAEVDADRVTHLVTVSCTGFGSPGVDIQLIREFGLPPTTQRVHVGFMGCHGALNGLRVAQGLAAADPAATVLLCCVELCSLHYRYQWDPERFLGNVLFADGAASVLIGSGHSDRNPVDTPTSTSRQPAEPSRQLAGPSRQLAATGSCLIPDSLDAMTWRIGDHGFEMTLSAAVPDLIQQHLRPWIERWLEQQGHALEDIQCWAVHPGGPRILWAVEQALQLPSDALDPSRQVLAEHGNMSSPTVLFILQQFWSLDRGGPCVMLGFGPGLVAEAALLIP